MNKTILAAGLVVAALPAAAGEHPKGHKEKSAAAMIEAMPDALNWQRELPGLPSGAELAVVEGDPSKPGFFALRLRAPAGYKVPPHWHPGAERLTILTGTLW